MATVARIVSTKRRSAAADPARRPCSFSCRPASQPLTGMLKEEFQRYLERSAQVSAGIFWRCRLAKPGSKVSDGTPCFVFILTSSKIFFRKLAEASSAASLSEVWPTAKSCSVPTCLKENCYSHQILNADATTGWIAPRLHALDALIGNARKRSAKTRTRALRSRTVARCAFWKASRA